MRDNLRREFTLSLRIFAKKSVIYTGKRFPDLLLPVQDYCYDDKKITAQYLAKCSQCTCTSPVLGLWQATLRDIFAETFFAFDLSLPTMP